MGALSEFIFQSKYSRFIPSLGRKETWEESVDRISSMHLTHLADKFPRAIENSEFNSLYLEAIQAYTEKKFLGSQRNLQYGGDPIFKHNMKSYNCTALYADKLSIFGDLEYILLCGAGVGLSVEQQHIDKLPSMVRELETKTEEFIIPDSIEGWGQAINKLITYFFIPSTKYPIFDYSKIRQKGALIAGLFIAPGSEGLMKALQKIEIILRGVFKTSKRLSALNIADIVSHEADACISGGIRRSAMIIFFTPTDEEMLNCKLNNWFYDNPQRGRFNMSAALDRNNTPREVYTKIFKYTKAFGEPGFFWRSDPGVIANPCAEIGFKPIAASGETGVQSCNLVTINGSKVETSEDFFKACKYASFIATIQATYNDFKFLNKATNDLAVEDPLIAVSIGGIMTNPSILNDPDILRAGAQIVKDTNEFAAKILGIKPSSRCTAIKPDGNASVLLEMTPGCHGEHAKHYIRRVQVNKEETAGIVYKKENPKSVVESVWSPNHTDYCLMFPISAKKNSVLKSELLGIKQLEVVRNLFNNWIKEGQRDPKAVIQNNVSNTVQVPDGQWEDVEEYVWHYQNELAGVSFIGETGDLSFNQPPYSEVLMPNELLDMYGDGVIFASGLIVDIIDVFEDLWVACDTFYGRGEKLFATKEEVEDFSKTLHSIKKEDYENETVLKYEQALKSQRATNIALYLDMGHSQEFAEKLVDAISCIPDSEIQKYLDRNMFGSVNKLAEKRDIIRRINKFCCKYFDCDIDKTIRALKHVQLYHDWCEITGAEKEIDWSKVKWNKTLIEADTMAAASCSGGSCEITKL